MILDQVGNHSLARVVEGRDVSYLVDGILMKSKVSAYKEWENVVSIYIAKKVKELTGERGYE